LSDSVYVCHFLPLSSLLATQWLHEANPPTPFPTPGVYTPVKFGVPDKEDASLMLWMFPTVEREACYRETKEAVYLIVNRRKNEG
jgi:hypothetical protein